MRRGILDLGQTVYVCFQYLIMGASPKLNQQKLNEMNGENVVKNQLRIKA